MKSLAAVAVLGALALGGCDVNVSSNDAATQDAIEGLRNTAGEVVQDVGNAAADAGNGIGQAADATGNVIDTIGEETAGEKDAAETNKAN